MPKQIDIEMMEPCIFRNFPQDTWRPGFFSRVFDTMHEMRPFQSMEGLWYEEIAPLAGNERCIGNDKDAFGLWDLDRLKEEGIIDGL